MYKGPGGTNFVACMRVDIICDRYQLSTETHTCDIFRKKAVLYLNLPVAATIQWAPSIWGCVGTLSPALPLPEGGAGGRRGLCGGRWPTGVGW